MPSITAGLRDLARVAIARSAHDVTDATAVRSALVIAPHPDDETLGCGATILRKRAAGTRVVILMVTDGAHSHTSPSLAPERLAEIRREELAEAVARLGLGEDELRWAGIEDGTVASHEAELAELIGTMVEELGPDEVYATSELEHHPDHAAVGRVARRATALAGVPLYEYPIWLWNGWPLRRGDVAGSLMDAAGRVLGRRSIAVRTAGFRDAKLHALDAHATQLRRPSEVPEHEPWTVLPASVLRAAGDKVELFFPVRSPSRS